MRVLKNGGRLSFTTFLGESDEKFMWLDELIDKYLPGFEDEPQEDNAPEFNTEEGLYEILKVAGFRNIRIICEEKAFNYKDEQEWWDKLWTHGYIKMLEMITKYKMEAFKTEVFDKLRETYPKNTIDTTL